MTTVTPPLPEKNRRRRRPSTRTDWIFLALGLVALALVLIGVLSGNSSPWWFIPPIIVIGTAGWSLRR